MNQPKTLAAKLFVLFIQLKTLCLIGVFIACNLFDVNLNNNYNVSTPPP